MNNVLPKEYQRVEYIESTGNQWIDTGLYPMDYDTVDIVFSNLSKNTVQNITGCRNVNSIALSNIRIGSNNKIEPFYGSAINTGITIVDNQKYHVISFYSVGNQTIYVDDILRGTGVISTARTNGSTDTIFGLHELNGSVGFRTYSKIYSCKYFKNNLLLRDFVPCYRKTDNVIGLYDLVNNVFYTNQGTVSFNKGPDIKTYEEEPKPVEIDWTESMEQTFEYYEVDPISWKDKKMLLNVKSSSISMDDSADTLGSATIDVTDTLGESYVRIYLVATQNGATFKFVLGTFLVQTPSSSYDGKNRNVSMDCYTPLLELKENPPPLGYSLLKNDNIMHQAYMIVKDNCRAPVVETTSDKLLQDNFVADPNENWLTFVSDLIAQAKYRFSLDENGKILFAPIQRAEELQPRWTYTDDNSSILFPEINMQHDLYGIPNVVEVVCSTGTREYTARVVNDDPNSPTSTINRGREILYRDTDPNLPGFPTEEQIDEYANTLLKQLSSVEYQVSYTHGYCPVRVGDCVRLNYRRADLNGITAKVISQSIKCENGCTVNETAIFTKKLWN